MFSLPVFEEPSFYEQDKILEDLLADCAPLEGNTSQVTDDKVGTTKKRPRKGDQIQENKNNSNNDFKKIMHRDIERQRRQEMSSLYTSLRSLLPLEYIKGKRSTSDHMHQAANYINDMQKKIEQLKIRRDKLKKIMCADIDSDDSRSNISGDSANYICVKVNLSSDGVEILISSCLSEFPLSKVLADLLAGGLNVISCVSTSNDERSLHKIQIEINDLTRIDVSELEERLVNVIKLA